MSDFLKKTLILARKGEPLAYPNPLVGAILVKNGKIIGQGYHKKFGSPHAEVVAINNCVKKGNNPENSTLYVNLEPCSHHGKTPPCTNLIIEKGIKKVVFAVKDPNPKVKGLEVLKKIGIETTYGQLAKTATELNKVFFKYQKTGLPYLTLKIASSYNFKIWSPKITKITGLESQKFTHRLRAKSTSVLTGINTILKDDPLLTTRLVKGENPTPIILDGSLKIPPKSNVLKNKKTIICTEKKSSKKNVLTFTTLSNLKPILKKLATLGHTNILVEGGQKITSSFLQQKLADKIIIFISDKKLGQQGLRAILPKTLPNLKITDIKKIGEDIVMELRNL
ncbi:MAG: riboflavin biosynthesis protein RibD [uncultured bacterium]|nr:MAG: riboflavin biosynthesis protein RibD [uncultured bacterium]KKT02857.1 MAG: 5-amino-6-(5-phosphoribosylamino)uracil reductase [Candidatus Peregrinibacteria bacterium GW2011_GWF2_43_17]KKT19998.1 MAG: Riboflavin biosynthesis protein RibD [Candidatus Peregrinibacteria bacterium GW2011_GWA2_43_8]HAU39635.1 bifunctional diaminohydroxyphosphoribosylaminopyrimidine deaminase/5-amino-6-(5-phosphoribosylamino)uracil reductase RibD [Candidatus Peregrinibacteria bacterium]